MPEPIAIAHLTTELGDRLRGAPSAPLAVDISVAVLTDSRWDDRSSVARSSRCVQIFSRAPMPV
jgi:hypothetical protein